MTNMGFGGNYGGSNDNYEIYCPTSAGLGPGRRPKKRKRAQKQNPRQKPGHQALLHGQQKTQSHRQQTRKPKTQAQSSSPRCTPIRTEKDSREEKGQGQEERSTIA